METFTSDEEFLNPNLNYQILIKELRQRIEDLQKDIIVIKDPEVLGIAQKIYTDLKIQYFGLLRDDLDLQHKFSTQSTIEDINGSIKAQVGDINEDR